MKSQNESLQHDGLLGMKWGVRRWRNPDGTLTDAGKERYNYYKKKREADYINDEEKRYYSRLDNSSGKSALTSQIDSYRQSTGAISNLLDTYKVGVREKSLAGKTDRELREAIERAKLEREYKSYFPTQYKTDTRKKLDALISVADGVLVIGSTASQIYSSIATATKRNIDRRIVEADLKEVQSYIKNVSNLKYDDFINMSPEVLKYTTNRLNELNQLKQAVDTANGKTSGKKNKN